MPTEQFIALGIDFRACSDKLGNELTKKESDVRHGFSLRYLLLSTCLGTTLFLNGCSSPAPRTDTPVAEATPLPTEPVDTDATPESLIADAQSVWELERDALQRNNFLLQAVQLLLEENRIAAAQQILLQLQQDEVDERLQIRLNVLSALAWANAADADTEALLRLLEKPVDDDGLRYKQLDLQAELYLRKGDLLAAANSYEQAMPPSQESVRQVWEWVNEARYQLPDNAQSRYPALRPYLALLSLVQNNGLSPQALATATQQFKQVYRGHRLVVHWPEELTLASELRPANITQILVMLPLSGRLENTGMAIKEGILSAYYQALQQASGSNDVPELEFVDTVGKSPQELVDAIGQHRWVIGPLLKETIEEVVPLIPHNVNVLALNRADLTRPQLSENSLEPLDSPVAEARIPQEPGFFSLAPEDEAYQLADHIFNSGYRAPIVVAAQSSIYQRMNDAFAERWRTLNSRHASKDMVNLTSIDFSDSTTLREGITQALDVAQSKDRINQIRYMVNEELYNVPRSRGDIDAIVVFASPEQTELLNPMVEASLSPFDGKVVPVYATSRSMEYDSSKNQWRDLQNVRFLDMPWMMPDNQWQSLQTQTENLWPHRSTQLDRLFAFGIDAYNLLPSLHTMGLLPQVEVPGLTGALSMNRDHQIERRLPQAKIDNESVIPLTRGE